MCKIVKSGKIGSKKPSCSPEAGPVDVLLLKVETLDNDKH
jgi:hypothetical protein